jgi:hypothetical protein
MTEAEWLACANHWTTIEEFLRRTGRLNPRKLVLFGCACCRRIWNLLEERGQEAVEAAERYADGLGSKFRVMALAAAAGWVEHLGWPSTEQREAARAAAAILTVGAPYRAAFAARDQPGGVDGERKAQYRLVCDLFGGPSPVPPGIVRARSDTVSRLAQAIYDGRRFEELPVLADALEEAGCTDAAVLDHCRQPGEHARGCWVLDALLGNG